MSRKLPPIECLDKHVLVLAQIVAQTSWLPHPETVKIMRGAVFPTIRNMTRRRTPIEENGIPVGLYDDNATAHWALLWTHGMNDRCRDGWSIAHVWSAPKDIESFTHLANLALITECFGSLTDKIGPVSRFLRWHAWQVYGWKPESAAEPQKPEGFEEVVWRYLPAFADPRGFVRQRLSELNNESVKILRPIMQRLGML
ncbi:MAG: hypothetical protein AAB385_05600 [Planctomycetota bacterium]